MIVGYGEPYTGTQVETPDTAKGEPKVLGLGHDEMAEVVQGRGLAKGNLGECNRDRTQCRDTLQQALDRVRQAARRVRLLLTALWHHIHDIDRLREAYYSVNRRAAPGVDGETWAAYGGDLEVHLRDLSAGSSVGDTTPNRWSGSISRSPMAASALSAYRRWRTGSSSGPNGGSAQCGLRGGLSRVLLRVPAGTEPPPHWMQ